MRMKKTLILVAALALSAACSHNYEVTPSDTKGGEIGFGTYAESLTRRTQGTNTFVTNDDFAVYGSKTVSGSPVDVFTGDVVDYDHTTSGVWDYTPHRFWDLNATAYTFFAFSPSTVKTGATTTTTATNGAPSTIPL